MVNYSLNIFESSSRFWLFISAIITIFITLPILLIFYYAIGVDAEIWKHIYDNLFFNYAFNSIILVIGVSFLSLFFGVKSAWIISFYNIPFKNLFSFFLILPLAIPPYALSYCYADLLDKGGALDYFINYYIQSPIKIDFSLRSIYGAIFILSLTLFPYIYLISRYSFIKNSKAVIEAAANLGASKNELFYKLALPMARPAIAAGLALVIMESLADFGVVHYLGVESLSVGIYKAWFNLEDLNSASRLAALLFTFALLAIILEKYSRKDSTEKYASYGKLESNNLFHNNIFFPVAFLVILLFLSLFIPISWLINNSYFKELNMPKDIFNASYNTIKLGLLGSCIIVLVSLFLNFSKRIASKFIGILINFAKIGYAAPGIVVAVGVMTPVIFIDKKLNSIFSFFNIEIGLIVSGSIIILLTAYLVRFLSVSYNPIEAAYEKISIKIDYAALNLGSTNKRLFYKIHFPMIFTSIIISFLLVFIDIIKELPATLILRPFNFNTLSVMTFEYASSEQIIMAAYPALLITLFAAIPLSVIHLIFLKLK